MTTSASTTDPSPRILLTGATGFIGGSILTTLLASSSPFLHNAPITLLLRSASRAADLRSTYGSRVNTVLYADLDDLDATTAAAAQHDIVINTTLGFHAASALALVRGLAKRRTETGSDVWMVHTSGTSNLADTPFTGTWVEGGFPEGREFDDAKDDVYAYEVEREKAQEYPQRTTELAVIDEGLTLGVKTLVIMSPTIYGTGLGLSNTLSIQIPAYIRASLLHRHAVVVGSGAGLWDHVHIADLADLYTLAILDILQHGGAHLPRGKKGIIFSGVGRASWMDVARGVAAALVEAGRLESAEVSNLGLEEGTRVFERALEKISPEHVEAGLSSNSRTVASVARGLGWRPSRGEEAWRKGFGEDVGMVLRKMGES